MQAGGIAGWFRDRGSAAAGGKGNGNARKGFLGFLQRWSGSLAEVAARGANRGGGGGGGGGGWASGVCGLGR